MQKLDFVKNLELIVTRLKSEEIVKHFKSGFHKPNEQYRYNDIVPLLFASKSQYDQIIIDQRLNHILKSLNADSIYSENNLSHLTNLLKLGTALNIVVASSSITLYTFHFALLNSLNLAKEMLLSPDLQKDFSDSIDEGIIVFQIVVEGEGLETEKYIRIFSALQELINTVNKIFKSENKSEIILLDSGSDTNVGIKTVVETATSVFLIFKEIWGFITTFRFQRAKLKNDTLLESLSIRAEIKKRQEEGIISEDEAREYIHRIKTTTDRLIGMGVLPKQIVVESNLVENKKLLAEFDGLKLLTEGDEHQ